MSGKNEPVVDLSKGVRITPEMLARIMVSLVVLGFTATIAGIKLAWDANTELRNLRDGIAETARKIDALGRDRWTLAMHRKWSDDLGRRNGTLIVPDPDDIHTKIQPR